MPSESDTDEDRQRALLLLVERFRNGDDLAAAELHAIFAGEMLNLARRHVAGFLTPSAVDVEGIVNSGFRSFFSAMLKPNFDSRGGKIGGLLSVIVSRKALVALRRKYPTALPHESVDAVAEVVSANLRQQYTEDDAFADLQVVLKPLLSTMTLKELEIIHSLLDPFDERSIVELANHHHSSTATIRELLDRIKSSLK
ncbi:hypothetical protein AB1L30_13220 [Bremerella sp. JC817]|uniref:RNA polymerase sigma factor n=1 Tax=Bremerella sp. JC817 TaxID=3231756 RepID=UPI0034583ECE